MFTVFAVTSAVFAATSNLLGRHLMHGRKQDAWAYSFYFSLTGTLVSLPFALAAFHVPRSPGPWALAIAIGAIIVVHNLMLFRASAMLEASLQGALLKLRLIWVLLFGIVLLDDSFSWSSTLGTVLVMAGAIVTFRITTSGSRQGVLLVLGASVLNALIVVGTKDLIGPFNSPSVTLFSSFLPAAILNYVLMPRANARIAESWRLNATPILLACAAGAGSNLALNQALSLGSASAVVVVSEVALIIILVGESIILKERERQVAKLVSVCLAVTGALLMQLG